MLRPTLMLFVIAFAFALLGLTKVAGNLALTARVGFYSFTVLAVISLVVGFFRGPAIRH